MKADYKDIPAYHKGQAAEDEAICDLLKREIDKALPKAESKIWHGSPVWFLDGNPIVGYHKLKSHVRILFWSGQSFGEAGLAPEGSFKAAQAVYETAADVKTALLRRWLAKAKKIQWDYERIIKNRGLVPRAGLPGAEQAKRRPSSAGKPAAKAGAPKPGSKEAKATKPRSRAK